MQAPPEQISGCAVQLLQPFQTHADDNEQFDFRGGSSGEEEQQQEGEEDLSADGAAEVDDAEEVDEEGEDDFGSGA